MAKQKKQKEHKPLERLKQSLTISNLWLSILSLSQKEPVYAYTLPKRINKAFGFSPSRLLTYLVLYRLEGEGYLNKKQMGSRKYYSITPEGKRILSSAKNMLNKRQKEL